MLSDFSILNFRLFQELSLDGLGRVNLITGKNNCGKTSLLEALRLYAERGSRESLWDLISAREEFAVDPRGSFAMRSLFHRSDPNKTIVLSSGADTVSLSLGPIPDRPRDGRRLPSSSSVEVQPPLSEIEGVRVSYGETENLVPVEFFFADRRPRPIGRRQALLFERAAVFVSAASITPGLLSDLWDRISLSDLEDDALAALRIVVPELERVSFIGSREDFVGRAPIAKLRGESTPMPLRRLGDGVNRMLAMSSALANAKAGILLIDEVENGIHYSVLPQLWDFIFTAAQRLDVQVFATTHSLDCIRAFSRVANESDENGALFRLENRAQTISAVRFDEEDLVTADEHQLEVR